MLIKSNLTLTNNIKTRILIKLGILTSQTRNLVFKTNIENNDYMFGYFSLEIYFTKYLRIVFYLPAQIIGNFVQMTKRDLGEQKFSPILFEAKLRANENFVFDFVLLPPRNYGL